MESQVGQQIMDEINAPSACGSLDRIIDDFIKGPARHIDMKALDAVSSDIFRLAVFHPVKIPTRSVLLAFQASIHRVGIERFGDEWVPF